MTALQTETLRAMRTVLRRLLIPSLLSTAAGLTIAAEAEPVPAPPADAASQPVATPPDNTASDVRVRIEATLDSWQQFIDDLLIDALGPDPERRYRVFGQRKTVDLGKRWTLALDERQTGRLTNAGTGIPAAGQPARTWELLHEGRRSNWRFYNQQDGSGRENGAAVVTQLSPNWAWRTSGLNLHDTIFDVTRTEAQTGLRYGPEDLWVEGFVRHARLKDNRLREDWTDSRPYATFGGVQTQWEALPGLTFGAQHQRAIRSEMAPGDERLDDPRTEIGADYRPGGRWSGSRVYWREALDMGLLSSSGVEERTTYKRVIGAETPEGSPDGIIYGQIRQKSLASDDDALLVAGWRHTEDFAPRWRLQTLVESGIPISGDTAVRSNTLDVRLSNNAFPHHAFLTEVEVVRTPIKDSAYAAIDYTQRLSMSLLAVARASATTSRPKELPDEVPTNAANITLGLGWQEPVERRLSTFWRYTAIGRDARVEGPLSEEFADRRAHIGAGEVTWAQNDDNTWLVRAAKRWDHNDAINGGQQRTSVLTMLRPTHRLAERWRLSVHVARLTDSVNPTRTGFGAELSVQMNRKIVLALGYNPRGIGDGEMAGDERIGKGVKLRLYIPTEATLTHWLRAAASEREGTLAK